MIDFLKRILKLSPFPLSKNHLYDKLTSKIIRDVLSEDRLNTIDVGCHKGEILDLLLKASPRGQHFGFEPIPQFYNYLENKYSAHDNCVILNYAASNEQITTSFNFVKSNPSYSGLKKRDYDRPNEVDESIEVKTNLIDNLIPDDIKISLIKIDVEGAELLVLEGAQKLLLRDRPVVVFEHGIGASDHYGATPDKVFDFLRQVKLNVSRLQDYVKSKPALSREAFIQEYNNKTNYYFIAHP